jgi:hypothetical protein
LNAPIACIALISDSATRDGCQCASWTCLVQTVYRFRAAAGAEVGGVNAQNFLGFGPQPSIEVDFGGGDRQHVMVKGESVGSVETVPLFTGTETIGGQVRQSRRSAARRFHHCPSATGGVLSARSSRRYAPQHTSGCMVHLTGMEPWRTHRCG